MWQKITIPFAALMRALYNYTGNYGVSIILFALIVNLVLTPFMAKSKKSMMRTTRLQPRIQELQRRHEGNQQKLQQEMNKLYQEEGINPASGCLWSLIPFPILIALYSVIRMPITRMMHASADVVTTLKDYFITNGLYAAPGKVDAYEEIQMAKLAHENWSAIQTELAGKLDKLFDLDFNFLGLNLGDVPNWKFWQFNFSDPKIWGPALGLFLIPFISAFMSWATMKISNATNPQTADAQQNASAQTMTAMMPLMSVWFCFIMPAAMGIYWIANSVFGTIRDVILTKIYKKQLDAEDAEKNLLRAEREKELEKQRLETERLRAEGKTVKNDNTSKKKIQANQKQKDDERRAAVERAERAARRERLGIAEEEKPASQVGNRRYARGRAYVPDRFTNPEGAEEATALAAAESEGAEAIDETVEEIVEAAVDAVQEEAAEAEAVAELSEAAAEAECEE